ncbi:hypothetical protein BGX34_005555, partial [Mortierella sp. NVP85]
MACFLEGMLIPLLERSPELKQLQFPPLVDESEGHRYAELALAVNSSCQQLDTLILDVCGRDAVPIRRLTSFLRLLTRGLKSVCLLNEACQSHERIEQEYQTLVPRTLFTTPSMDTIQVLNLCATTFYGSEISQILQSCRRLRELRAIGDASFARSEDVSLLVAQSWACRDTLEVLEVSVTNLDTIAESINEQDWYESTGQNVRQFFLLLKSLPELRRLVVSWMLTTGQLNDFKIMDLSLEHLNKG